MVKFENCCPLSDTEKRSASAPTGEEVGSAKSARWEGVGEQSMEPSAARVAAMVTIKSAAELCRASGCRAHLVLTPGAAPNPTPWTVMTVPHPVAGPPFGVSDETTVST